MTRMVLRELSLLCHKEEAAYSLEFHPEVTVIRGPNDTGKSSLIKSIPWCFGAEPSKMNDRWTALDIVAAVRFSIGPQEYTVVRDKKFFGLFDSDSKPLIATTHVSGESGLGTRLARLLNFGLLLTSRENKPAVPPPAFYFLPYYLDQDASWIQTWAAFSNLSQFSNWKKDLVEYHIGLRANAYYERKTKLNELEGNLVEPKNQHEYLKSIIQRVRERFAQIPVDFDLDRFKREIEELLGLAKNLAQEEDRYRVKLSGLADRRSFLEQKLTLARRIQTELDKDYQYTIQQSGQVQCTMCGATYENNILEKFQLAFDVQTCDEAVRSAQRELIEIADETDLIRKHFEEARVRHTRLWELLETKQDTMSLAQVLMGQARGQTIQALQSEADEIMKQVSELLSLAEQVRSEIAKFESKDRRTAMLSEFEKLFRLYCVPLAVNPPSKIQSFHLTLKETGSDLPRLILAYQFAILNMIWKYSDTVHSFVLIDSLNQSEQDPKNLRAMLDFLNERFPPEQQLVLGLVDSQGAQFRGKEINLKDDRRLLSKASYATVNARIRPLIDSIHVTLSMR